MAESLGLDVEVKLFKQINKEKTLSGKLIKFDNEKIYIEINSEEIGIERMQIAQIKIKYEW